jgi:hypothetical protein
MKFGQCVFFAWRAKSTFVRFLLNPYPGRVKINVTKSVLGVQKVEQLFAPHASVHTIVKKKKKKKENVSHLGTLWT